MTKHSAALSSLDDIRRKANSKEEDRNNFNQFVSQQKKSGWSDEEASFYAGQIKVLLSDNDAAALALFPDGVFATAAEARDSARAFWKSQAIPATESSGINERIRAAIAADKRKSA